MKALICVFFAMLAGLGCRPTQPTGTVRVDPALAVLAPAESVFLAGVRMEPLRETPIYKKWIESQPPAFIGNFAGRTGFDLRKDLWEVLVASDGIHTAVMARGQFGKQGMEPKLEREGARRTPYKGFTLIGNDEGAVAFLNATTAVAGSPEAIRAVIDQRNRPDRKTAEALLKKVEAIPSRYHLWAVSASPTALAGRLPQQGNMANLGKVFSMLENVSARVDLSSGLDLDASGDCRNGQDAKRLADSLRGLIGLARLSTPDNQSDMLRAYDGIRVELDQNSVRLRAAIPEELLEKMIARFPVRR